MRADKSLSPFEIRLYRHYRVVHGIRIALAFLLTFLLVRLFNIPEGTWPLITLVVIMGPISFWGNVVPRAFERIGGTILGSVLGLIALRLELFSLPLMLIWCAVAMFLCGWLALGLPLIHISEPTRLLSISYAVFCLKKKNNEILNVKFIIHTE